MVDPVIEGKTRNRWKFCSFYTDSGPITSYMVSKLNLKDSDNILEPCAGTGAFIDEILRSGSMFSSLEAIDLNPEAIKELKKKYSSFSSIFVRKTDTLFDKKFDDIMANKTKKYSKIIGNPPYGAWQSYERRAKLKKKYGGYVKDSYTLFLNKCISLLNNEGVLTFIIPDTFMALNLHRDTRENLIKNTTIKEILLIPSNYFPGVRFGHSGLCVITLLKKRASKSHKIRILQVNTGIDKVSMLANGNYKYADRIEHLSQFQISKVPAYNIMIGGNEKARKLLNSGNLNLTLGDLCECVTGFYSGDNKKFLRPTSMLLKTQEGLLKLPLGKFLKGLLGKVSILTG